MSERTEIIKTLADVVGVCLHEDIMLGDKPMHGVVCPDCKELGGYTKTFNPFTSSADNDALVEAFVGRDRHYVRLEVGKFINHCEVYYTDGGFASDANCGSKNEAVCMAIWEAVK